MVADSSQKIVITGGAGFIGSAVAWMLNLRGLDDLLIVDQPGCDPYKWKNLRGLRFRDIQSPQLFLERLQANDHSDIDVIIHLGACSATTEQDADFLLDNNYRYSQKLAAWALEHGKRFIYASSAAVYGDGNLGFSDDPELLPRLRPLNMYGYSKQLFDLYVQRNGWDSRCVGLRFFNIFGPNEYHKKSMRSMVYQAVQQIRSDGEVRLFKSTDSRFGDGEQVRDFYYVKDAVEVIWQLMQRPDVAGIYNVGSGAASTWNSLAEAVFQSMERQPSIRYIDMPQELVGRYQSYTCADISALSSALGCKAPCSTLSQAVHDYACGYLTSDEPTYLDFIDPKE